MAIYYFSDEVERTGFDAGVKARKDVEELLQSRFSKLSPYVYKGNKYLAMWKYIKCVLSTNKDDTIILQYPMVKFKKLLKFTAKRRKCVVIIHDLQSLRLENFDFDEMGALKTAHILISHNQKMTDHLVSQGVDTKIINLNIFDYLCDEYVTESHAKDAAAVCFAGNLSKSVFLEKIPEELMNIGFNLYGKGWNEKNQKLHYCGAYDADIIHKKLQGNFGLIWDGEEAVTCTGLMGEYMKYNNPHKLSMYIVAGMPVVVWDKSAIANYVLEHDIGFAVSSLADIPQCVANITDAEYEVKRKNVIKIAQNLSEGKTLGAILDSLK